MLTDQQRLAVINRISAEVIEYCQDAEHECRQRGKFDKAVWWQQAADALGRGMSLTCCWTMHLLPEPEAEDYE